MKVLQAGRPPQLGLVSLLLCLASVPAAPQMPLADLLQEAHAKHLAQRRTWLLLLHYHHQLFGNFRSDLDEPEFFFARNGATNPEAELDATLTAFTQPSPEATEDQVAACRFPARFEWLNAELGNPLPSVECPRFKKWREQMDPDGVTLVFASYYMNNPASMYGHTFLRLHRRGDNGKNPLLDYTVNFAAYPDTHNAILYTVEGLMGGFRGRFSTMPYYMKVQEYNNLESRDLWEYDLRLTSEQIDQMLRHLWELGPTSLAYYFFIKNCSYELLPLLEVANPDLHLTDQFHFKAIPVDTLRVVLDQPALISSIRLRPSHLNRMLSARSDLTPDERHLSERLAKRAEDGAEQLQRMTPEAQARVLDSAYNLFRFRTGFVRDQPAAIQDQERSLLVLRNAVTESSMTLTDRRTERTADMTGDLSQSPEHGHRSGRVGVGFGWTKQSHFEEFSARMAIHDQGDDPLGYIPGSRLEMFHLRLRYDNDLHVLYPQEFTLVDILSLSPLDPWVKRPSWNVGTGLAVASDQDKDPNHSLYYGLHGGPGVALESHLLKRELYFAFAQVDMGAGHTFDRSYRIGGGTNAGMVVEATSWWRIVFDASVLQYALGDTGPVTRLRLIQSVPLGRDNQLCLTAERDNTYKEVLLNLLHYL